MEENENENNTTNLKPKLSKIAEQIKHSWIRDCDETEYMIELIKMLKEMQKKESLEEYFSNDENALNYFMDEFYKDVIQYILIQPIIYGNNGDEIGLDLLLNTFKLFLKFHKNKKYSNLFEKIREIFHSNSSRSFFKGDDNKNDNPIKKYDFNKFNEVYNKKFVKPAKSNNFKVGDEIDIPIEIETSRSIEKKSWVRGRIKEIENDDYIIEYCGENGEDKKMSINSINIFPAGVKTVDWEWRTNLKKWDVIDCYDRNKWYPATIMNVIDEEINGFKRMKYKIGFRLYTEHFKNLEDENDTYEKHLDIWRMGGYSESPDTDSDDEKFFGDRENYDETIVHYSKRIQKFNTFSKMQQKYLNYSYNGSNYYYHNSNEDNNPMKTMNEKLEKDTEISIEDFYNYDVDGQKNCIIGKNGDDFQIYFAVFLKNIEKEGGFKKFIEILQDKPNAEEIYTIFFIFLHAFSYIHKDYFKENSNIIKNSLIDFINNLDNKEMRNLPKDLIEIVSEVLKKIANLNDDKNNEQDFEDLYDEMTLTLSMKTIKTSIFDRRLQGIKALNEYIEKNQNNQNSRKKLVNLIKKNEIIQEIFGANYHSQLINKSNEIVKLLLIENELSEKDFQLIWSCTKKGDLEAKITILKLLSELADNLKEEYIEMLLNSILSNIDKKIDEKEIELVYRLSIQGNDNEKNILICCDYLCQCLLSLKDTKIENNPIFDKLLMLIKRDNPKYLQKVLDICENCLGKNENSLLSYSILFQIMDKLSNDYSKPIFDFVKDQHLLKLFEDNFKLYIKQAKELLEKNNISFSDGKIIDKYLINGFTHLDNIQKRIEIFPYLINYFYKDYDFLPFLKEVLINNAVSPNDQSIFFDFMKNYISKDDYSMKFDSEINKQKEKIKQELFELISENNQKEVTTEQIKLFISIFFEMNKDKIQLKKSEEDNEMDYEVEEVQNIDELKGLDKLWKIILKIKDETVLSVAINLIFQLYKNKYVEKLLVKCNSLIKEENATSEVIDKCIILLKLIIIESEKKVLFKPKSHLSLLKNCFIKLPLEMRGKRPIKNEYHDMDKHLLLGNITPNDLKIILSKLYALPPKNIKFTLSDEFLSKINEIKDLQNKEIFEKKELEENVNNISFNELLLINNKLITDLKPNEKITFGYKKLDKAPLIIGNELNPKLKLIFQNWFKDFTDGSGKMDNKAVVKFIGAVTNSSEKMDENDPKVKGFIKENDKNEKGYVTEEEFLDFYLEACENKEDVVWKNLIVYGYREDLNKKGVPYKIEYVDNDKLPRYKLGNDLSFIQTLIKKYYQNPNGKSSLYDFILYLTTNEKIYNEVLNMYNDENKDSFVNKALNDKNKYIEQNYIFIIIESIIQDLEIYLYNESNDMIKIGDSEYKLITNKYEPFDNEEIKEKKINFFKTLIKAENFKKIINYVNNILMKITKSNSESNNNTSILFTSCLRGLKLIEIINNLLSDQIKENYNCIYEFREKEIYNFGYCNLTSLIKDVDIQKELDNISFFDLSNNLINYLNYSKSNKEKDKDKYNKCLHFLIDLLSSKKQLVLEYFSGDDNNNKLINDLFLNSFSDNDSESKDYFMKSLNQSIQKAIIKSNGEYLSFLYKISNSLLDNLINAQSEKTEDENKNIFSPDTKFFELYNHLYKLTNAINNQKDKAANENEIKEENSFLKKVYNLLMRGLSDTLKEKDKKNNDKIILNLFKLFIIALQDDENLKNKILFEKENEYSLFELLYKKSLSQIKADFINKEENDNNNLLTQNENETEDNEKGEDKFICLETIKEEKKEDNSSSEELSELINQFIYEYFKESKNLKNIQKIIQIIDSLKNTLKKKKNGSNTNSDSEDKNDEETPSSNTIPNYSSRQHGHVGLKNLGCICYMNSIMQQIYMVPTFRYAVMHADDGKNPKPSSNYRYSVDDDNLLHQLQEMYTYLTFSEKMDYNPRSFCYSFKDFDGNPINVGSQQDSQEFYNNFCDKIENSLKNTKFKYIVNDVFTGRTCSSVLCQNCKNISNRFEDFYNLTLEVKNLNNLSESLQKLIVPEIIDDFQCSNCNQKVRISKITSLNRLPNVLVVHLKRFYLDYETCHTRKINSKFEFPKKLNLKPFCVEEITKNFGANQVETTDIYNREDEYYQYELKGINVHTGSADGGHYFSFIDVNRDGKSNIMNDNLDNKNNWLTFNDSHVSEFDVDKIPSECFGGNTEGYSFENCQNAYLLIYERRKKTPIKIIIDEKEVQNVNEDNIVKIDKDNANIIRKDYDLSRIGNNIDEQNLYNKIFLNTEKNEYFKYIPYYNIPKYAPRKAYLEVMKENNKTPSTKSNNKKYNSRLRKYKDILIDKITNPDFDFNTLKLDDDCKQNIISITLNNFMKKLNKNQSWDKEEIEEINKECSYLIKKIIKPVIDRETDINILTIINRALSKENNYKKIFLVSNMIFANNSDYIINLENANIITDIFEELISIFINKRDESKYHKELTNIIIAVNDLIKSSKTKSNYMMSNRDENEKHPIIYIFKLLYKLLKTNDIILSIFINNGIIKNLLRKLDEHNKEIRNIIYDMLIFIIKQTKDYRKELFDLKEDEKEGDYNFKEKEILSNSIDNDIINLLFKENKELLLLLLIIFEYNNDTFMNEFNKHIYRLFKEYEDKDRDEDLIEILLSIIKINDKLTYTRLLTFFGYPQLVVKSIPREIESPPTTMENNNNFDDSSDDDDSDSEKRRKEIERQKEREREKEREKKREEEKEKEKNENKQKWPLFGEKLIDGDINKQVYEYITRNHRKKSSICLLALLFPSEYSVDEKEKEEKDDDDNDDNYARFRSQMDEEDSNNRKKKIVISEDLKKKILIDIINNCLGEKENYALFKYIYLMPARSLLYKNLYEEIIEYLKEEKTFNLEKFKKREEKFIKNIEKEIEISIEKAKKKTKKEVNIYDLDDERNDDDDDDDEEMYGNSALLEGEFKCYDTNIKKFIGFNSNIIPGEIVREELIQIATSSGMAMYRLVYYTKYFKVEELRKNLLNNKDKKIIKNEKKTEETNKEKNEEDKNEESKKEEKKEDDKEKKIKENENSKEKEEGKKVENDKKEEEKEEEKKEDKKEEKEEEKEEEEKEEENKEEKEEEKKEDKKEENKEEKTDEEEKEEEKKEEKEEEKKEEKKEEKEEEKKEEEKEEEKKEEEKEEENKEEKEEEKKEEKEEDNKEEKEEEKKEENKEEKTKEKTDEEKKEDKSEKEEKDKSNEEKSKKKEEDEVSFELKHEEEEKTKEKKDDKEKKKDSENNEEEEITETEITNKLDLRNETKKYDISEKNENSFIYSLFDKRIDAYILEDKSIKNKNKVKITFIRFVFTNTSRNYKNFRAKIKETKSISSIESVNYFNPKIVSDRVEGNNISYFHSIYRLREDLLFIKDENIGITIDFNDN